MFRQQPTPYLAYGVADHTYEYTNTLGQVMRGPGVKYLTLAISDTFYTVLCVFFSHAVIAQTGFMLALEKSNPTSSPAQLYLPIFPFFRLAKQNNFLPSYHPESLTHQPYQFAPNTQSQWQPFTVSPSATRPSIVYHVSSLHHWSIFICLL